MIQKAQKWKDKPTQHNNRNIQSQRNKKMLVYTDTTCNIRLSSANKCHMQYNQLIGNCLHRGIISATELQLLDDSGLTHRLIRLCIMTFRTIHNQGNNKEDISKQYINQ